MEFWGHIQGVHEYKEATWGAETHEEGSEKSQRVIERRRA
jgi:hypothetical protein